MYQALPEQTLRRLAEYRYQRYRRGDETIVDILGALGRNADLKNVAGIAYRE